MAQKFFTGDKITYIGNSFPWKRGEQHIIYECKYCGQGVFEYTTNRGAWFDADDFELVHRATPKTFKELDKDLAEDMEE